MKVEFESKLNVYDNLGFIHSLTIWHWPSNGISIAYDDDGNRIGSREYGRLSHPVGDSDKEWEEYEERFHEWTDAAIDDLILECQNHFNSELRRL